MIIKNSEIKRFENIYEQSGNQLVLLYGRCDCGKENLLKQFVEDKKCFYYRCRQASELEQKRMMGQEIARQYEVRIQKYEYDEYFNRIKSGNPSKLVVVIDECQYLMKKDPEFIESILKLKNKRLYPGPVMILLCSSSIVWAEQDLPKLIGSKMSTFDHVIKVEEMNFLDVVRAFPTYQVSDCITVYGILGGVPEYLNQWNPKESLKENICRLVLSENGYIFSKAEQIISAELRELSVYNTILSAIAGGCNKLNDLYRKTGFSRAKISVYMKNLAHFDIIEKVISFETGGWENAKKGIYQIKDTYVNFWYRFVYPNLSNLYWMSPEEFYDCYIDKEVEQYLNRCFRSVCMEYLILLNQIGKTPIQITKMGTWVGKTGNIDIIAQNSVRENMVGLCNWTEQVLTMEMCEQLFDSMKKAKITSDHFYLFSAKYFSPEVIALAKNDARYELIDMKEL